MSKKFSKILRKERSQHGPDGSLFAATQVRSKDFFRKFLKGRRKKRMPEKKGNSNSTSKIEIFPKVLIDTETKYQA